MKCQAGVSLLGSEKTNLLLIFVDEYNVSQKYLTVCLRNMIIRPLDAGKELLFYCHFKYIKKNICLNPTHFNETCFDYALMIKIGQD